MKVVVRLFGTMGQGYPGYDHTHGMDLELPDGARVSHLLARLEMPRSQRWMVVLEGQILKADAVLKDGASVNVVPPFYGG
ncbi:MAG: MoaD/ThiS family protein [Pseudomonadota bacterium]